MVLVRKKKEEALVYTCHILESCSLSFLSIWVKRLSGRGLLGNHCESSTQLVRCYMDSAFGKRLDSLLFGCHLGTLDLLRDSVADVPNTLLRSECVALKDVVGFVVLTKRSCVVENTEEDFDVLVLTNASSPGEADCFVNRLGKLVAE